MAHVIIILRKKLEALKGDATEGLIPLLLSNVNEVDDILENGEPANAKQMHEALEALQGYLVDGTGSTAGVVDMLDGYNTTLEGLI